MFPPTPEQIEYVRCVQCGLVWSPEMCSWPDSMLSERVYNQEYGLADPPFLFERAWENAQRLRACLPRVAEFRHLDFGGGQGFVSRFLRVKGVESFSFDPYFPSNKIPEQGTQFELLTAFEVLEHAQDQRGVRAQWLSWLHEHSVVLFSTLLQPGSGLVLQDDLTAWWYACPRNGHIVLHTKASLDAWWKGTGFQWKALNRNYHLAWHRKSLQTDWLARLIHEYEDAPISEPRSV